MSFQWKKGVLALAAVAVIAVTHPRPGTDRAEDPRQSYVPRPHAAKVLALGQEALLADLYWLKAVQLIGGAAVPAEYVDAAGALIDVATSVDPWIDHPYRFAATWMNNTREQVERANQIMRRGVAYHPDDWRNRFYLSFNHFFYLGEDERAAEELAPAVAQPGSPRYLGRLHARLKSQTGGLEVAAVYLRELLENTEDGYRRAEYEKALDEIQTEHGARFLDQGRKRYRELYGRDIETVEDLVHGKVLASLPREPHDWEWVLDPKSGEIVSSYYNRRYRLNLGAGDRARRDAWSRASEAKEPAR